MTLKTARFITLFLAALTLGMGLCHVLEMPARLEWERELWVGTTVHGGLYRMFGSVGAVIVVATAAMSIAYAWQVRNHPPAVARASMLGAALFVLALAGWWVLVFPVNLELASWLESPVPDDWAGYRLRWETGHALNTMLQAAGFAALLVSVLAETPGGRHHK